MARKNIRRKTDHLPTADEQIIDLDGPNRLLSIPDAAALLGLQIGTLDTWRSTGRHNLPYVRVGGRIKYRLSDVREWLDERTCDRV